MALTTHRLFFAVRPPPEVAAAIGQVAAGARSSGLLRGHWLQAAKYHITVHFLGGFAFVPEDLVERARSAADALRFAAFDIVLDRMTSFPGRRQSPCILCCTPAAAAALRDLWSVLRAGCDNAGATAPQQDTFVPHLTIAYANRALPEPIPIEPLRWRADEFLLLHSDVSAASHKPLGSWALE